jgi:cobalt-zinc-cadmium efflux system protein
MNKSPWWIRFRSLLKVSQESRPEKVEAHLDVVSIPALADNQEIQPVEIEPVKIQPVKIQPVEIQPVEIEPTQRIDKVLDQGNLHFVQCISPAGLHKMAYSTWGDPNNPRVLICVHGLTRRGSDFAVLARNLSERFYVVCPDVVGRGNSDYLSNPMLYGIPQYVSDMVTLIAHLNPKHLHWFGTSMGGLIGMVLAGLENQPIERLLLNDVGPRIDPAFFVRLMKYLGKPVTFSNQEEALQYANSLTETFGRHTPEQLRELNLPQIIHRNGVWGMHYDPQINAPIMASNPAMALAGEAALWKSYDNIKIPILIVRGQESDLLSTSTLTEMCARNPHAKSVTVPDAGHAPAFILPNQLQIAREFFE